jgi:hypothetical protein
MARKSRQAKYTLESVFEQRNYAKKQAALNLELSRERLRMVQAELLLAEQSVENCKAQQADLAATMLKEAAGSIAAKRLIWYRMQLVELRDWQGELMKICERRRLGVVTAEMSVEQALDAFLKANKDFKAIGKHRELWLQSMKQDRLRRDQKSNEEVSAVIWNKQRQAANHTRTTSSKSQDGARAYPVVLDE